MILKKILLAVSCLGLSVSANSSELYVEHAKALIAGQWKIIEQQEGCSSNIKISFTDNPWPRVVYDFGQRPFDPKGINSGDQFKPILFSNVDLVTEAEASSTALYFEKEATLKFIDKSILMNSKTMQIILTKALAITTFRTKKNAQELQFEQFKEKDSLKADQASLVSCTYRKD